MSTAGLPERRLSMLDCASIVVGIIIGSGIYESTSRTAAQFSEPWQLMSVWLAGGIFSLVGAWCYAELATRFPQHGGDYVYLTQAFGRRAGLLFAWTQLWVIRPGSIGAMGCVFAAYAIPLQRALLPDFAPGPNLFLLYACGSIVVLSLVNMAGVRFGTRTQNLLTGAKVLGLAGVIVAGLFGNTTDAKAAAAPVRAAVGDVTLDGVAFALIFVLFAYSGWNEIGCITAEVRNPQRTIMRALVLAASVVTLIYLGMNFACLRLLGLDGMAASGAVATDAVSRVAGRTGELGLALLICVSALGSTNGMIFTGARIYYAFGKEHSMFAPLARWSPRFGTPTTALALQGIVTAALVVGFSGVVGEATGGDASAAAGRYDFERLVMFMTPPFYLFLAGSAAAVVVFRLRGQGESDCFRAPLFPLPPIALALASLFLAWKGTAYAYSQLGGRTWWPAAWVGGTLLTGLALAAWRHTSDSRIANAADDRNQAD